LKKACESITRHPAHSERAYNRYSAVHNVQFKEITMLNRLLQSFCVLALIHSGAVAANESSRIGDLEMHSTAVPTLELTPEAAKEYNVTPSPNRGLLTVTLIKKQRYGKAQAVAGQVYAGGFTQNQTSQIYP
jgi:hypothetical protein